MMLAVYWDGIRSRDAVTMWREHSHCDVLRMTQHLAEHSERGGGPWPYYLRVEATIIVNEREWRYGDDGEEESSEGGRWGVETSEPRVGPWVNRVMEVIPSGRSTIGRQRNTGTPFAANTSFSRTPGCRSRRSRFMDHIVPMYFDLPPTAPAPDKPAIDTDQCCQCSCHESTEKPLDGFPREQRVSGRGDGKAARVSDYMSEDDYGGEGPP